MLLLVRVDADIADESWIDDTVENPEASILGRDDEATLKGLFEILK